MPRAVHRLVPWGVGLAHAALVAALLDRMIAEWALGAPPRSWPAWRAAWGLHVALVGLAALGLGWLRMVERASGRRHGRRIAVVVAAGLGFAGLLPLGREITAGPWISAQPLAPVLRYGPALAAAGASGLLLALARAWPPSDDRARARTLTTALWVAGGAVPLVEWAWVAPGGFLHTPATAIALSAVLLTAAGLRSVPRPARDAVPRPARDAVPVALAFALSAVVGLSSWPRPSPAVRAELLLHAPTAATVLRILGPSRVDPLPALLATPLPPPVPPPPASDRALPRGTSVVFVTVDALRADALPPLQGPGTHPTAPGDTPFLDAFLERSVVFTRAHAQSSKTVDSMPAMFRSLHPHEDPATLGQPLGAAMSGHGYHTLAVVNEWFLVARVPATRALMQGFERVEVYEPPDTDQAVPWALGLVDEAEGAPFFLWLHLYSSHHPGFADRPLDDGDGPWPERYRHTVRWLDGQLEALWSGLRARGLSDRVVLVLAADHGEGLGDNGVELHGYSVFEEEIAVPLWFHAAGLPPARIDATVGNIDVVPTLYALLGLPPEPTHRGHSLLPLVDDPALPWPYAYYARNRYHQAIALVQGPDKLVLDTEAGVAMRFDLDADPTEDINLFRDDPDDRRRLHQLLRHDPHRLATGLERGDETTRALLLERLRALGPDTATEELDFVLPLAAHEPTGAAIDVAAERFDAIASPRVRLRILRHLYPRDPAGWGERLQAWLEHADDPRPLVTALAARGQPMFAPAWVAEQLRSSLARGIDAAEPWLTLVAGWDAPAGDTFAAEVTEALRQARAASSRPAAIAGLTIAPRLHGLEPAAAAALAEAIVPFVDHGDPTVEVVAVQALAHHPRHDPRLAALIDDPRRDIRVRQAALRAVGHAQGEAAVGFIEHAARSPRMMVAAILLLSEIAGPEALAALRRLRQPPLGPRETEQLSKAIRVVVRANATRAER